MNTKGYEAIRTSAAVYVRGTHMVRITGGGQREMLQDLIARPTEYAEVGSALESLVLDERGVPVDILLCVIDDESVVLMSDYEESILPTLGDLALQRGHDDISFEELGSWSAVEIEGPRAWAYVDGLIEDDIAALGLNEWRRASLNGLADEALLIRTGTTAEYGYLLLAEAGSEDIMSWFDGRSDEGVKATPASAEALDRARIEVNHPLLGAHLDGLTLREAAMGWMGGIEREDDFRGKPAAAEDLTRRLVVVESSSEMVPGAPVFAGDEAVGEIRLVTERLGQPTVVGLALLQRPFDVPGLELRSENASLATRSRPAVEPRSWTVGIE